MNCCGLLGLVFWFCWLIIAWLFVLLEYFWISLALVVCVVLLWFLCGN